MAARVLLLHNRYRAEGGEERAVAEMLALLRARGHEVALLERTSGDASTRAAARGLLTGGLDPEAVGARVRAHRAEIVHAHNLHPLLGWRALAAARAAGARTVLHLHNFRLHCAVAVGFREGELCFECRGRRTEPAVRHSCRGSRAESAVYAAGLAAQYPRLLEHADVLVAVSNGLRDRLAALGTPRERIRVLHNPVPTGQIAAASRAGRGTYALTTGRLAPEKGFDVAITAARTAGVPLVVAGDGPDRARLEALARADPASPDASATATAPVRAEVTFTGHVDGPRLAELRAGAMALLVPSLWEEPFPYAALEGLAAGLPVLASDRGGLPEAVGPEGIVAAGDGWAWTRALRQLAASPDLRRTRGEAGLRRVRERFGEDRWYAGLMAVYAGRRA